MAVSINLFSQKNSLQIELTKFDSIEHNKIYRIDIGNYQCLELIEFKNGKTSGTLINSVCKSNRKWKNKKLIFQKIKISENITVKLIKTLTENNFDNIPDCKDVKDCIIGLDGITTTFSINSIKINRTYSYWEIGSDYYYKNKEIPKEVFEVRKILIEIEKVIDLRKEFENFKKNLPKGTYGFNGIIMTKK